MSDQPDSGGVEYDPTESLTSFAMKIQNTVVPGVLVRGEFYAFLFLNVIFTVLYERGILNPKENAVPGSLLKSLTALMVFFLVFYTNNCFSRYFTLYAKTRDMMGGLYELVSETRLRIANKSHRRKVVHYMLASVFAFFFETTQGELSDADLEHLRQKGLLNMTEISFLQRYPAPHHRSFVILQWVLEVAKYGLGDAGLRYLQLFTAKVYGVRRVQQDIVDTLKMPLPFQYFHIMNVMLLVNLSLMAQFIATFESYPACILYMFAELIFMGIREMSTAMADPFGDDEVDFPVNTWMQEVFGICNALLEYEFRVGTTENCACVPPLQDEQTEAFELQLYESRRARMQQQQTGGGAQRAGVRSLRSGAGGNTPLIAGLEDVRVDVGSQMSATASRGKMTPQAPAKADSGGGPGRRGSRRGSMLKKGTSSMTLGDKKEEDDDDE